MNIDKFELELTFALRDYVGGAPTEVDPLELARRIAGAHPRRMAVSQLFARNRYSLVIVAILGALILLASFLVAQALLQRRPGLLAFQRDGTIYIAEHESPARIVAASDDQHTYRLGGWSPDGQLLAIGDIRTAAVFEPATGELTNIPLPAAPDSEGPLELAGWSPDSQSILVLQPKMTGPSPLLEVDVATGLAKQLIVDYTACFPVISPDGRSFVWLRLHDVVVTERSTGETVKIGEVSWLYCGFDGGLKWDWPTWSADSERVVFVANDGSIETVARDGSAPVAVAAPDPGAFVLAAGDGLERPLWSPDGSLISYLDDGDLMVVRPDGSESRLLAAGPISARLMSWTSDSTHIDFLRMPADHDGTTVLWSVEVASGDARPVDVAAPSVEAFARQP